ncbi:hypothetical protein FRB93_011654 [Tulasnella sp. JGI-2019a]|nr:hypothetical protein FRB93_011654 [Tulasnella sp. JGI-2019a]
MEREVPPPLFHLKLLSWGDKPTPTAIHWLLQSSKDSLKYLQFLRCPVQYGENHFSLRLQAIGAISVQQLNQLPLTNLCPVLREFLVNDAVGHNILLNLPQTIRHVAFHPSEFWASRALWQWEGLGNWLESWGDLEIITLTGRPIEPFQNAMGRPPGIVGWATAVVERGVRLDVAAVDFWCDTLLADYQSPVLVNDDKYQ